MRAFAELFAALEDGRRPLEQRRALVRYLRSVGPAEAAWAVRLLLREAVKTVVRTGRITEWAREAAGPLDGLSLFDACLEVVGDPCEAAALFLPAPTETHDDPLDVWLTRPPLSPSDLSEDDLQEAVFAAWRRLESTERFVFNRLLAGWRKPPVERGTVVQAVAEACGQTPAVVEHRLAGVWAPSAAFYAALTAADPADAARSRPYPFRPAAALVEPPESLGEVALWRAEWRYDGLRIQLLRRGGDTFVWSRGGDLLSDRFPELASLPLPDGAALDGQLLPWKDEAPLPAALLARRLECKLNAAKTSAKRKKDENPLRGSAIRTHGTPPLRILREAPVRFVAFDLLEEGGEDLRGVPFAARQARLARLLEAVGGAAAVAPELEAADWETLDRLREKGAPQGASGLVLKRRDSIYRLEGEADPSSAAWRAWPPPPHRIEAVLTYVQRGSDGRSTELTFGLWRGDELVTFAVAPNDLPEAEAEELERIVRRTVREKFGPVASLHAECVFEVAFERIEPAPRRKSGVAVSGVRAVAWRREKGPGEAARLEALSALLPPSSGSAPP